MSVSLNVAFDRKHASLTDVSTPHATADIADGAITNAKIADGTIKTLKLANYEYGTIDYTNNIVPTSLADVAFSNSEYNKFYGLSGYNDTDGDGSTYREWYDGTFNGGQESIPFSYDLGSVTTLKKLGIKSQVYSGKNTGFYIEISEDGSAWTTIASKTGTYTSWTSWTIESNNVTLRYLRVRVKNLTTEATYAGFRNYEVVGVI